MAQPFDDHLYSPRPEFGARVLRGRRVPAGIFTQPRHIDSLGTERHHQRSLALPGIIAAFILSLVLTWNEYFFAALLTSTHANTLPVMVASQTGSQGINWWAMAALSFAAILPLVIIGVVLERYLIKGMTAGAVK